VKRGITDFKRTDHGGSCPPPGMAGNDFFKIQALVAEPAMKARATKPGLLQAMRGRVLPEASLAGVHQRHR
jgi:phosphatidylethanolamine-binding protein (PEBP) family uncharacterized protein